MKDDMELKKEYNATFAEIHAPEALAGKVKNMAGLESKKVGVSLVKKLALTAAAFAALFVGSNGVAYAATGSTWIQPILVRLNGTEYQVDMEAQVEEDGTITYSGVVGADMEKQVSEDGTVTYSGVVEEGDGPTAIMISGKSDEMGEVTYNIDITTPEVVEEDGRIYFTDGDVKVDITEDLADGEATGTYEVNGVKNQYQVTGNGKSWDMNVWTLAVEE
ncbi:MAG: hypothetical protein IJ379_14935 [Lachnospiraceae bacterium]|nr:hypothetical protein [Lachnospiraceae bacterium]